ncbi:MULTISPECIES: hypothetical protein [Priestia]|jgi:hypothetical protein|uniref:Uncharacterized protein n=1 Tax=Priestia megaterium TaxID=1404 RepID=A0A3D8X2U2_PRIMG|nr:MULTISPECIES: hypothetical protein [Priestia]MDH3173838.1 hypothetical protein [Priestia megaterium]MDR7244440.1 hypothetical protein [Priestia megaterium]QTL50440.1 hypothetical protein J5Z55_04915 [Priestia aryabhattai]RDZ14828.1 hypothetical protein C3744_13150 [Priestia megaterium]USL43396.1 hypothetical protein LIS78_04855 [Priestia megaterium]
MATKRTFFSFFLIGALLCLLVVPNSVMASEKPAHLTVASYTQFLKAQSDKSSLYEFSKLSRQQKQKVVQSLKDPSLLKMDIEESSGTVEAASTAAYGARTASPLFKTAAYTASYKAAGFTTTKLTVYVDYYTKNSSVTSVKSVRGVVTKNVNPLVSISKKSSKSWVQNNRAYGRIDWQWKIAAKNAGIKRQTAYGTASGASGGSTAIVN